MAWGVPKIGTLVEAASGNVVLVEPAGVAEGDLMIACIAYRSNAAFTLPANWTVVATQQSSGDVDASAGIASGVMAYIVRGASAPALTFTRTAGDLALGRIISYSGGRLSPYDTGSANTLAVSSVTATTGTFNTAAAGELIVAMTSAGDLYSASAFDAATDPATASGATDTTTAPTNGTWIERTDNSSSTGADGGLAIADAIRATAGATGTIQATMLNTGRHVMIAGAFKLLGTAPTTALNTPADAATGVSTTPTLNFTGTDADSDTVEYNVQVNTVSDFDIDSYAESNKNTSITLGGGNKRIGQSFTGDGSVLGSVAFFLDETSSTGDVTAAIYAHSGTFGTNSVGTGAALATSEIVEASTIGSGHKLITFNFTGGNRITLTNATKYVVMVQYVSAGGNINVGVDNTSPSHGGNSIFHDGTSTWDFDASYDVIFYVFSTLLNKTSTIDTGFTAGHPFASGAAKDFTVQAGDTLTANTLYYWRVRAVDPLDTGTYGGWATTRSFTTTAGVAAIPNKIISINQSVKRGASF